MELVEHNKWLNLQNFKPGNAEEICQCGTEEVIKHSSNPELMRAELLSYVFLDQLIHTHYPFNHSDFKKEFPGPKLCQHSFGGHASPGWLLYSRHGYDASANWQLIKSTLRDYLTGALKWLRQNGEIDENNYWVLVKKEITQEFETAHQTEFMSAIENVL